MSVLAFTNAPKVLPWLAHEAGVDSHRAEMLWRAALRNAGRASAPNTSEYWQIAMNHLRDLLAAESQRADLASFGWRPWARSLAGWLALRVELFDKMTLASARRWHVLDARHGAPRLLH
jgi:hypothetical protein